MLLAEKAFRRAHAENPTAWAKADESPAAIESSGPPLPTLRFCDAVGIRLEGLRSPRGADMLIVNGDPTQDIDLLRDFDRNLLRIVKDGQIHKNILERTG
jgi:hypothetical protein